MERGLNISSLSDLTVGRGFRGEAGGRATLHPGCSGGDPDFQSLAWVAALEFMDLSDFDGTAP
jgi:hypothetical protein